MNIGYTPVVDAGGSYLSMRTREWLPDGGIPMNLRKQDANTCRPFVASNDSERFDQQLMNPLLRRLFRLVLTWSIFPCLISCTSLIAIDFDAVLDDMVGKTLEQNAPKLVRLQSSHREGDVLVNEYWRFNTGVCRWILFVNAETGVVTAWRYPDKTAAFNCNNFPASMP